MQYIIGGLEKANIPYIEGGSTLHIPDYAERILKTIENRYSPENKIGFREQAALDIDLLVYNSNSLDDLLSKLQEKGYEIKRGKYLAVKPQNAERFIRLISLGTGYTENNLAKRIAEKELLPNKFNEWEKKSDNVGKRFCVTASEYIVAVRTYKLTPKKHNRASYYCFQNDAKIQKFFKQLITIDEFGFSSREQIYAKANELQNRIGNGDNNDELREKLTKVRELISVYEEVIEGNYIDNLIKEQRKTLQQPSNTPLPTKSTSVEKFFRNCDKFPQKLLHFSNLKCIIEIAEICQRFTLGGKLMASIEKRGTSFRIKVSCGYRADGKQVFQRMTWTPDPKMTAKQIEKEVQRQAVLFEEA